MGLCVFSTRRWPLVHLAWLTSSSSCPKTLCPLPNWMRPKSRSNCAVHNLRRRGNPYLVCSSTNIDAAVFWIDVIVLIYVLCEPLRRCFGIEPSHGLLSWSCALVSNSKPSFLPLREPCFVCPTHCTVTMTPITAV